MSKTRGDYGSDVTRPKINTDTHFELKGQFLKELYDNTFSGSEHEDANKHIKKVMEIVDLFHIPNITQDQIMLQAFPVSLTGAASRWLRNKPAGSILTWDVLKSNKVLQERGFGSLPSLTKTNPRDHVKLISTAKADSTGICRIRSGPYAVLDSQISNIFCKTVPFPRRLHAYCCDEWEEACELKILETYSIGTTLYDNTLSRKEKDLGSFTLPYFIHNVCFDKTLVDLGASVCVMPFSTYTNLGLGDLIHTRLTVELSDKTIKHPRGIAENELVRIDKFIFPIDFIILDIPEDEDVPLILGRPFLSTAHAKIDVFKIKITLRVGEKKIVFKSIKPATSILRMVYMLRTNLDSKTELIGEDVNKLLDPHYGDYIELNDLDVPLEPKMNQDDNF
ncbi:DNA/RNA polymerases superfamily protein [Tanacetum coccineum]|uniref:DNA/RNA polymerases superfamily protein n=1 Tax=Tanacetum coccineum TaxID=301880 RepID=A0ABQ5FMD0_9ASTR